MNRLRLTLLVPVLLLILSVDALAQIPTGTEFLVTMPPLVSYSQRNDTNLNFRIEIMCSRDTKVSVRWATPGGGYIVRDAQVNAGDKLPVIRPMFNFADILQQYPNDSRDTAVRRNGRAWLVTSDQPVAVQATFEAPYKSESWMVPPTSSYDTAYTVATYNAFGIGCNRSGFLVTAKEDNTVLTITPHTNYFGGLYPSAGNTFLVGLNAHEVYWVMSSDRGTGDTSDLSGSRVISTKPIGVLAFGTSDVPSSDWQDTTPPPDLYYGAKPIVEPILPDRMAGTTFYTRPFVRQPSTLVRVIGLNPNTTVMINGSPKGTTGPSHGYDVALGFPTKIETSGPAIVMQYAFSGQPSKIDTTIIRENQPPLVDSVMYGDPMMAWVPPVSAYTPAVQWIGQQMKERAPKDGSAPFVFYWHHYVMITAPASAAGDVRLDGNPVTFTDTYSDGQYVSAVLSVTPSKHIVESDEPLSALAWGFTWNDSYGLATSEALRSVAKLRLDSIGLISCEERYDTTITLVNLGTADFRIDSIRAPGLQMQTLLPPSFPWTVPAKDSTQLTLALRMPQPGTYTGSLQIYTDAHNSHLITIPMTVVRDSARLAFPSSVDFARLGSSETSRDTSVVVTNDGERPLILDEAFFDKPGFSLVAPTLPDTVGPGASDTLQIRFAPTADGEYDATMRLVGTPCLTAVQIALTGGKGSGASLQVQPSIVSWPAFSCANPAPDQSDTTVVFRNNGDEPATITTATIGGQNASEFSLVDPSPFTPQTVLPGDSAVFTVRYTPNGYGARRGELDLTTTAPNMATRTISLLARRDLAAIEPSTRSIDFGDVLACADLTDTVLVLANSGTVFDTLNVGLSADSPFEITAPTQIILFPGGTTEIPVRFRPIDDGTYVATITITGSPCGLDETVELHARRISPSLTTDSMALDLGTVFSCESSRTRTITLRNDGPVADTLYSASTAGSPAFSITPPTDTVVLAPGATTSVTVTLTPGAPGAVTGAAVFDWGPCGGTMSIDLSATLAEAATTLAATDVDFGQVNTGSTATGSIDVRNDGVASRTIDRIDLPPGVTLLQPASLPVELAPGATLTLVLEFSPTSKGTLAATATVHTADPCGESLSFDLKGEATGEEVIPVDLELAVPALTGDVDTEVEIPISIVSSKNLAEANADSILLSLRYRSSMLLPRGVTTAIAGMSASIVDDRIDAGERTVTIAVSGGVLPASGEVARLTAFVLLGDTTATTLTPELVGIHFAEPRATMPSTPTIDEGEFTATGQCVTGGDTRLVRIGGALKLRGARPNPFHDAAEIEYDVLEAGPVDLVVLDATGHTVRTLVHDDLPVGRYTAQLRSEALPSGLYSCELRRGAEREHVVVILVK